MANKFKELNTRWLYLLPIALSIFIVIQIALGVKFNFPPDEAIHVDGMCYFESHWWPPPLNYDDLLYSPDGWSRVYNGESVYLFYGKLGTLIKPIVIGIFKTLPSTPVPDYAYKTFLPITSVAPRCVTLYQIYRILNVILLLITLLVLFLRAYRDIWVLVVGLLLLCIPQVLYIYAYANSDAWGLSISIFLFVFILTTKTKIRSKRYGITLGILIGLLLLCKETFWLSLSWAIILIGIQYFQQRIHSTSLLSFKQEIKNFIAFAITLFVVVAPLKLIYPLSQGNWSVQTEKMREIRSREDFKPSVLERISIACTEESSEDIDICAAKNNYRLAAQNKPVSVIVSNSYWIETSLKSFYGFFGHLAVILPNWVYAVAFIIVLLNIALTMSVTWLKWSCLDLHIKTLIIFAPISILIVIMASVYNSWTYDFQPQGRYLFSALVPLAILVAGTVSVENKGCILFRVTSWLVGYVLCVYALIYYAM